MADILLAIDIQNGFVSDATRRILPGLENLMASGRFQTIIATRFVNVPSSPYRRIMGWEKLSGPPETDLVPFVERYADTVIEKHVYTAVCPELMGSIRRGDVVHVAGIDTDCCVLKTAADLFENDVDVRVLADLCASNGGPASHEAALKVMERVISERCIVRGPLRRFREVTWPAPGRTCTSGRRG